jgi:uncharacterized repeat protein (TIGR01451 family)
LSAFVAALAFLAIAPTAGPATLPSGFAETEVVSGLSAPTAMAFAPDGRLFVAEQGGRLRVIKSGMLLAAPFLTVTVDSSGERGFLGVAFDPAFASNGYVYVYYTATTPTLHNRVSRFTASGDVAAAGSEVPILDLNDLSNATNHNGGAIHFGPDGKLYIAVGDNANGANSQTLANVLGKVLRINPDGTIPSDNPFFASAAGINRAIWALGLRNPFTFSFQPGTTRMFINDVGETTWEEIDDGIAGSNYGWPTTEGPTTDPRFRSPIFWYGHGTGPATGCAITGGAFYNPPVVQFPGSYVGTYFFADFCSGWIRSLDPANGNVVRDFSSGAAAPVDLAVGSDGSLYYLTRGGASGSVHRVSYTASVESTTTTQIHSAAHQVVTTVEAGSIVHDFVTVTGQPNQPTPTGDVVVDWFTNGTCSGGVPAASSGNEPLVNGRVDETSFSQGPLAAGSFSFRARYLGDNTYPPSFGECEPLQVVEANITITPNGVDRVGRTHTFTAQVKVNVGGGFVNAPDGTQISFTIDSGAGSFAAADPNPCTTSGGTGSCSIHLSSTTTGVTAVSAHTMLSVNGLAVTRNTDGTRSNSGLAAERWVNASIEIAPSASNEVGQSHTFNVTVKQDAGDGNGFVAASGTTVSVTLTDTNGAAHSAPTGSCASATTDSNGQCTIAFTSNAAGTATAHATSTLAVAGSAAFTTATDGASPNSGDAVTTFVDANVEIAPLTDNNRVSTNHTLTAHVNTDAGTGFGNAANGSVITFSLTNAAGASAAFVGPNTCTTGGGTGSCSVVINSSTIGTTTVEAATTVTVNGVALTRTTGDAKAGDGADASMTWADDTVRTDILNPSGAVVTTVVAGVVVRDRMLVQRAAGTPPSVPNPTGEVAFHRYTTADCTGTPSEQTVALTQGDPSKAVSAGFAPTATISYKAEYLGDANYPARTGVCERLTVTPVPTPAIAIVTKPKNQKVAVGATAKFRIRVRNVGNTTLTNVRVTDPLSPNCNRTSARIPALASMARGTSVTYSCSRPNVRRAYGNVATATGTPPSGPRVRATDTAPVKVKRPPPRSKRPKATG